MKKIKILYFNITLQGNFPVLSIIAGSTGTFGSALLCDQQGWPMQMLLHRLQHDTRIRWFRLKTTGRDPRIN